MASYVYPAPPVQVGEDLTTIQIHSLMKSPAALARRVRTLAEHKFIADYLLQGRYIAQGGAILYETGESIFPNEEAPERIAPGGAFPAGTLPEGGLATAKVTKWGRDYPVTDEAISRFLRDPVDKALRKGVNGMVRFVDSVALSVIASKVTSTYAATGAWTSGLKVVEDVLLAKATHEQANIGEGFNLSVVVLSPIQHAKVIAALIKENVLPREAGNPVANGEPTFPNALGLKWVTSPYCPFANPLLVDVDELGGMADEKIDSPGYGGADGIEVKSIRDDDHEMYRVRTRRVTVPVVREPKAALQITGTGI